MSTIPNGPAGVPPSPSPSLPSSSAPAPEQARTNAAPQRSDPWAALRRDEDPTDGVFEVRDLTAQSDVGLVLRQAIDDAVAAVGTMLRAFGMEPVSVPRLGDQLGSSLFEDLSSRFGAGGGFIAIQQSTSVTLDVRNLEIFQQSNSSEANFRYTSVSLSIQSETTIVAGGTTFPSFLDLTGSGFGERLSDAGKASDSPAQLALRDVVARQDGGRGGFPQSLTLDVFAPLLAQSEGRTLLPSSLFARPDGGNGLSGSGRFELRA